MKLSKCPRCDLNYITEAEKYCKVCLREMKGDAPREEIEMCSVCNEAPALPGHDVCVFCLKEMNNGGVRGDEGQDTEEAVDTSAIGGMDSVSTMDEIIPEIDEDIPSQEFGEIESELSLESVREEEDQDDDEDEDDR
ncbi:MAG: hypothetical protein IJX84_04610 [Clostridia bacterium]|nr:hypothetical protein [Clostridia bacterium]